MDLRDAAEEVSDRLIKCAGLLDGAIRDDAVRRDLDQMTRGAQELVERLRRLADLAESQAHIRDAVGDGAEAERLRARAALLREDANAVAAEVLGRGRVDKE